jgi:hypothetical protein
MMSKLGSLRWVGSDYLVETTNSNRDDITCSLNIKHTLVCSHRDSIIRMVGKFLGSQNHTIVVRCCDRCVADCVFKSSSSWIFAYVYSCQYTRVIIYVVRIQQTSLKSVFRDSVFYLEIVQREVQQLLQYIAMYKN